MADIDRVHGRYSVEGHMLRKQLEAATETASDASDRPATQAA